MDRAQTLRWGASGVLVLVIAGLLFWDSDDTEPRTALSSDAASASPVTSTPTAVPSRTPETPTRSQTSATTSASATTTASPRIPTTVPTASDDGPPLPPDAAHGLTIAAAEETVRFFYLEAENYLKRTGIGAAVTRASDPSCAACQHAVTYFRTRNGANRQLGGDYLWRGADIRMVRMTGARTAVVDVNVQTGRHTAVEKRGSAPKAFKGGTNYFKVSLLARGGRWIVFEVEFR